VTWEIWTAYVIATTILCTIPGPTVLLVVGYALSSGRGSAWWTVPGVTLGNVVAMAASLTGLGALLAASADAFTVLKWIGAAYLVYLGVRMWRADPSIGEIEAGGAGRARWSLTAHAFAVTALNPKGIAFFIAFLPQFISPAAPVAPQLFILGVTFLAVAMVNAVAYAFLAGGMRARLSQPRLLRAIKRTGGGLLIGAGIMTAALRRSS
jgi:threonine/homoserine/homoserine lactone efflux protein